MRFEWPIFLWGLALLPVLLGLYWYALKRRRVPVVFSSLSLLKPALTQESKWRRHLPPALMGLALLALVIAMARPTSTLSLPSDRYTVVLAMDVSLSMRATDMKPNRISAAKEAAKAFVADLPPSIRVGIVAFAGNATVVQTPTSNHDDLMAAIDAFQLQRGTATGTALLTALNVLVPDSGINLEELQFDSQNSRASRNSIARVPSAKPDFVPVAPGSFKDGVIVLLSDGRRTAGVDPAIAARWAADRGVKVFTVGFGSRDPNANANDEWQFYLRLDEDALRNMAETTGGEYFYAGSSADLKKVYEGFNTKFALERKETEVSALFSALAGLLTIAAAVLSLRWNRSV